VYISDVSVLLFYEKYIHTCVCVHIQEVRSKSLLARHLATGHGLTLGPGSPCPVMKTRAAFCLITTPLTRISRRICRHILDTSGAARRPFVPINVSLIKQECKWCCVAHDLKFVAVKHIFFIERNALYNPPSPYGGCKNHYVFLMPYTLHYNLRYCKSTCHLSTPTCMALKTPVQNGIKTVSRVDEQAIGTKLGASWICVYLKQNCLAW